MYRVDQKMVGFEQKAIDLLVSAYSDSPGIRDMEKIIKLLIERFIFIMVYSKVKSFIFDAAFVEKAIQKSTGSIG